MMAGEYFRAVRVRAFVGIRRTDLDPLLSAAAVPQWVWTAV